MEKASWRYACGRYILRETLSIHGRHSSQATRLCVACNASFAVKPSEVALRSRCPECIDAGRFRCLICGKQMTGVARGPARRRCSECQAADRVGREQVKRIVLECRGATLPWGTERGRRCLRRYRLTVRDAKVRQSYDPTSQRFQCRSCHGHELSLNRLITQIRAKVTTERIRTRGFFLERVRDLSEMNAKFQRRQQAGAGDMIRARRGGKGGPAGEAHRISIMVSAWKKRSGPGWQVCECRWCGKMLIRSTAPTSKAERFHASCWHSAIRTAAGQQWWRDRLALRRQGVSKEAVDQRLGLEPPLTGRPARTRRGRDRNLSQAFGWTVRYLLGGTPQADLAREDRVEVSTVSRAVAFTLEVLPDPEIANKRFRPYVTALQSASAT